MVANMLHPTRVSWQSQLVLTGSSFRLLHEKQSLTRNSIKSAAAVKARQTIKGGNVAVGDIHDSQIVGKAFTPKY